MNKTIGRETVIEVGGKKYVISRFDREVLQKLLDHIRKITPHPLDAIRDKLQGFPEAIQHRMVDRAMEKAARPIGYGSPEYEAALKTPEVLYHLLYLLLLKHQPTLTEKEAMGIYDQSVVEHGYGYIEEEMAKTSGELPTDNSAVKRQVLQGFGLVEADPEKKG